MILEMGTHNINVLFLNKYIYVYYIIFNKPINLTNENKVSLIVYQ
jgi:hypothetical protein